MNVSSFREEDFMYKKGYNADANKDKAMKNFLIWQSKLDPKPTPKTNMGGSYWKGNSNFARDTVKNITSVQLPDKMLPPIMKASIKDFHSDSSDEFSPRRESMLQTLEEAQDKFDDLNKKLELSYLKSGINPNTLEHQMRHYISPFKSPKYKKEEKKF